MDLRYLYLMYIFRIYSTTTNIIVNYNIPRCTNIAQISHAAQKELPCVYMYMIFTHKKQGSPNYNIICCLLCHSTKCSSGILTCLYIIITRSIICNDTLTVKYSSTISNYTTFPILHPFSASPAIRTK